jgi:hypothetical protein
LLTNQKTAQDAVSALLGRGQRQESA